MKNKIIIALVVIIPFLVFGAIQAIKNTENNKSIAYAVEKNTNKLIIYKYYKFRRTYSRN